MNGSSTKSDTLYTNGVEMQNPVEDQNTSQRPRKLLDQVRDTVRLKHYSMSTERTYVAWIKRYMLFRNKQHPKDMDVPENEAFLTHLSAQGLGEGLRGATITARRGE